MDQLDATLTRLFAAEPRIGVLEASRRLGVARGTVAARLAKLEDSGVVTGWGPELDPAALGHPVTAFLTLEIRQDPGPTASAPSTRNDPVRDPVSDPAGGPSGGHEPVARHLARIPEVLEAYTITGAGDLWVRVVARSNADLQRVIDAVLAAPGVVRSATVIALATQIPYRVLPLVEAVTRPTGPPDRPASSRSGR